MIGIMNQAFTVHETSANLIYAFFSLSLHFFKPKHKHHYLYFEEESWQRGCPRQQALDRGVNFTTPTPGICGAQSGDVDRLRNYKTWKKKNEGWCLLSAGILTSPCLRCVSVHCSIRGNVSFLVYFPQTSVFGYAAGLSLDSENLPVSHPWRMLSNVCQMAKHMWDSLLPGEARKVHTSWDTSGHHYYSCSYNIYPLSFFPLKLNLNSPSPTWLNSLQRRMEPKDNEFYTNRNKSLKINEPENARRRDHRSY